MPSVLICAPDPLTDELHRSLLWREGIERYLANRFEDALAMAVAARPNLVVVDRDLPRALRLVEDLRKEPSTRGLSIVVLARGDLDPDELRFIEAGANAILRLPAGPEWDERLSRLLQVPRRRAVRMPVRLEFEGRSERPVETVWGAVLDVSLTGMRVECRAELGIGADLDFSFRLARGSEPIVGCGRVVRRASTGGYGVEFYGLEGDGKERIRRFVEGGA